MEINYNRTKTLLQCCKVQKVHVSISENVTFSFPFGIHVGCDVKINVACGVRKRFSRKCLPILVVSIWSLENLFCIKVFVENATLTASLIESMRWLRHHTTSATAAMQHREMLIDV